MIFINKLSNIFLLSILGIPPVCMAVFTYLFTDIILKETNMKYNQTALIFFFNIKIPYIQIILEQI